MAIVTISREAGSLGDEIARDLAAELGYKLIEHQDFNALAEKYDPALAAKLTKLEHPEGLGFFERLFFSTPVYVSLFEALVFELASQRQVVIMGRGAQIVLRGVRQVLRVRVVAPKHLRVLHLRRSHNMTTDEAVEYVRRHDQQRHELIRKVYDQDPRDWNLYDLVINTGSLDTAAGVNLVKAAISEIMRLQPMEEATKILLGLALGKRVEARIRQDVLPTRELEVLGDTDGTVTLMGTLAAADDARKAEEIAEAYPGVARVVNQLITPSFTYGGRR